MTKNASALMGVLLAAAVTLVLVGHLLLYPWFVYIFKPLATILILSIAFTNWRNRTDSYSLWITTGLLCSLIGDVFLILPSIFFLPGLFSFLLAHIAYLVGFTRGVKFPARTSIWLIYLAIVVTLYAFLYPNLPIHLKLAVIIYALLLASMTAQAMGRAILLRTMPSYRAAIGAVFFMLSDILLALDRFHALILLAPVLILIPYYLAQWLIACSTDSL
jgi:uncharacterized membrane protein YhhN